MARKRKFDSVLGVFVTDALVDSVLMQRTESRIRVINRFGRPRSRIGDRISDLATVLPGLKDSSEADFTLEVGDGTTGSDPSSLFLSSEFGAVASASDVKEKQTIGRQTTPITTQLKDILAECANLGHDSLHISFCLGSADVAYVELSPPKHEPTAVTNLLNLKKKTEDKDDRSGPVRGLLRKHLVDNLEEQGVGLFDKKRVAFVPMTRKSGRDRYLAVVPRVPDSISPTLKELNSGRSTLSAVADIVDAELPLYLSLAQQHADATNSRNVAVIRVGAEDTMLLFVRGRKLAEFERIRSLTSYDPSETVCSRVLLKQDESKFGELDLVLVVSEERRDDAKNVFQEYFPSARVEWLQDVLAGKNLSMPSEEDVHLKSTSIPAIGIGLRWMEEWDRKGIGTRINLIPKRLVRRKKSNEKVAWHTYAMLGVLFACAFFYSWKFMTNQQEIDQLQRELAVNPPVFPDEDPAVLKMRVDSLNNAYQAYTRALGILDSLLVGSDKWTRSLAKMTESTRSIGSVWLKGWTPTSGASVRLEGNALSRSRIARLAQEWNGSIESLNFADIGGVRVYTFTMHVPIQDEMPPVAIHLRETALEQETAAPVVVD